MDRKNRIEAILEGGNKIRVLEYSDSGPSPIIMYEATNSPFSTLLHPLMNIRETLISVGLSETQAAAITLALKSGEDQRLTFES